MEWKRLIHTDKVYKKVYREKMLPRYDLKYGACHYDILFCHSRVIAQGRVYVTKCRYFIYCKRN